MRAINNITCANGVNSKQATGNVLLKKENFFSFSNFINNVHSSLRFSGINLFIVRSVAISNLLIKNYLSIYVKVEGR